MEGPPVALLDPWPGTRAMVLDRAVEPVLAAFGEVHAHRGASGRDEARVDALLPRTVLVLGQTHLPAARLARAPLLEAVVNLAGKWQRFVHQAASRARGIEVLAIAPAMAPAVAEWVLAAILDRLRGLGATDRVLLSTHRAGGGAASYAHLRPLLAEDLGQIHAGSPPLRLQRAESALACRTRSR